jgi:hypothetical protein
MGKKTIPNPVPQMVENNSLPEQLPELPESPEEQPEQMRGAVDAIRALHERLDREQTLH